MGMKAQAKFTSHKATIDGIIDDAYSMLADLRAGRPEGLPSETRVLAGERRKSSSFPSFHPSILPSSPSCPLFLFQLNELTDRPYCAPLRRRPPVFALC